MFKSLSDKGLLNSLVVTQEKENPALRAAKNIKTATSLPVAAFNVYDAVKYENLVIENKLWKHCLTNWCNYGPDNRSIEKTIDYRKTSILGEQANRYGFIVDLKANKNQIQRSYRVTL